jgi:hypothetical protein
MTVVGMLAVLFGVAGILAAAHALTAPLEGVVAVGLMLLGAALVVTGRTDWSLSRRHWPVWLGFGMILVLFATSSTFGMHQSIRSFHFGKTHYTAPPSAQALASEVDGGFGKTTVDLSALQGPLPEAKTIDVNAAAGPVDITLPPTIPVHLDAHLVGGVVCAAGLGDLASGGPGVHVTHDFPGRGGPTLTVDVQDAGGRVQINGACS